MSDKHAGLKIGSFYWVHPVLDPDTDEEWWNGIIPARYAGDGLWFYLDHNGPSDWPAGWIGPELVPPVSWMTGK